MAWYKKQLLALQKKDTEKITKTDKKTTIKSKKGTPKNPLLSQGEKGSHFVSASPVAQRNRNRDKTDLY